jgi:hypothetical protein
LRGGGPGVVVLAVEDEFRDVAGGEVVGLVACREEMAGHGGQSGGVAGEHSLAEEFDDRDGYPIRDRLRLKTPVPDLRDLSLEVLRSRAVEELQHGA